MADGQLVELTPAQEREIRAITAAYLPDLGGVTSGDWLRAYDEELALIARKYERVMADQLAPVFRMLAPMFTVVHGEAKPDNRALLEVVRDWADVGGQASTQTVQAAFPGIPPKVVAARLRKLMRAGLLDGCDCGCWGGWELSPKGRDRLLGNAGLTKPK